MEIKPLIDLDLDRFHELVRGYTSSFRYHIEKTETDYHTSISLNLQELEEPYQKRWYPEIENDERYSQIVKGGLSAGVYEDGKLLGIAIAEKQAWNRTLWIWEFHIEPEYRGMGLGKQLMSHMVDIGRKAGCRVMLCETQNTNVPAIRFYRSVGFEIGAIDLSYYTNRDLTEYEVAVFMKRFIE